MKLDRLAFGLFKRAFEAAIRAPGDAMAHDRFEKWARLVSRMIGLPITGCTMTDASGRARWVRVTAGLLVAALIANYGAGVWLNPSKPKNPAPSQAAIGLTMTVVTSSTNTAAGYFLNTVTGKDFLGFPPLPRKPTAKST